VVFLGALWLGGACRKPTPAVPPPEEARLPPMEVKKDGAWLYTYVDDKGQFATADKPDAIPPPSGRSAISRPRA